MLIGYVFDQPNGKYKDKYYFEESLENVAKFIMQNVDYKTIITDRNDEFVCSSLPGGFLNSYADKERLDDLLDILVPLQAKELELVAIPFKEAEDRVFVECK